MKLPEVEGHSEGKNCPAKRQCYFFSHWSILKHKIQIFLQHSEKLWRIVYIFLANLITLITDTKVNRVFAYYDFIFRFFTATLFSRGCLGCHSPSACPCGCYKHLKILVCGCLIRVSTLLLQIGTHIHAIHRK